MEDASEAQDHATAVAALSGDGGDSARSGGAGVVGDPGQEAQFASRVVTEGLAAPIEIVWGPDGYLWVTERVARRVVRVNPEDGSRTTAITIDEAIQTGGQDGVLGMALHPKLLARRSHGHGHSHGHGARSRSDYVYIAYSYDADPGSAVALRIKIRRYTFDPATQALGQPLDLLTNLPASVDHNSGKLVFGPDEKLYYTIGDQGGNQFGLKCAPIRSQELPTAAEVAARDWSKYVGKILRMNLDGSIPRDNPRIDGTRSHIYSYGHRNAQGITFGPHDNLYANEHGPKSDDELNLIQAGKNYGWPNVSGYRDNNAYTYDNWSASSPIPCEELEYDNYVVPDSVPQQKETEFWHPDFKPPLRTFFTVGNDHEFDDPACTDAEYICWPTIAPSSLTYYAHGGIPGWNGSLLMTSLKEGALYRVKLNASGKSVVGPSIRYFNTTNRYRDVALSPDGRTIYVITDSSGPTQAPGGGDTTDLENRGAILEFAYTGAR